MSEVSKMVICVLTSAKLNSMSRISVDRGISGLDNVYSLLNYGSQDLILVSEVSKMVICVLTSAKLGFHVKNFSRQRYFRAR